MVKPGELTREGECYDTSGQISRLSRCQLLRYHQGSTKLGKRQEMGQELKDEETPEVRRGLTWRILGQVGVSTWNLGG